MSRSRRLALLVATLAATGAGVATAAPFGEEIVSPERWFAEPSTLGAPEVAVDGSGTAWLETTTRVQVGTDEDGYPIERDRIAVYVRCGGGPPAQWALETTLGSATFSPQVAGVATAGEPAACPGSPAPQPTPTPSPAPGPGASAQPGAIATPASPPATPAAVALKPSAFIRLPSNKRCVSRRHFRIRLRAPKGLPIASATVRVNGRKVATRRGRRVTAPVDLRGLPKGRFTVKVTVVLKDGRRVDDSRRYRTCTPKRRHLRW